MRFIKNDIQTPKQLVPEEKRKSFLFMVMVLGVSIFVVGTAAFIAAFFFRDMIQVRWDMFYRDVQTYAIYVAAVGAILYIITAMVLGVPLRSTTYYKVQTIMKNEVFDPPRKGDFTKALFARLRDLEDDWAFFAEVRPAGSPIKIPQVIVGPAGVFTTYPSNENPERKRFTDPNPAFEKASQALGKAVGQSVLPIVVFSSPKLVALYKDLQKPKTRAAHIQEISSIFERRKRILSEKQRQEIETVVLGLIDGTPPGEKFAK